MVTDLERLLHNNPQVIYDSTISCYRILYTNTRGVCVKGIYPYKDKAEKEAIRLRRKMR